MKREATEAARHGKAEMIRKAQRAIDRFQSGDITGRQFRKELGCLKRTR